MVDLPFGMIEIPTNQAIIRCQILTSLGDLQVAIFRRGVFAGRIGLFLEIMWLETVDCEMDPVYKVHAFRSWGGLINQGQIQQVGESEALLKRY